jgi:gas vesicle protein
MWPVYKKCWICSTSKNNLSQKGKFPMSDNDEFGAFLVGFIVGGLAGAVAALLMAPQSGEETRAIIKERSIELRDKAGAEAEEAWRRAEAVALDARKRADELARQAMAQGEEISLKARERGMEMVENIKDSAKKATTRKKGDTELPAA